MRTRSASLALLAFMALTSAFSVAQASPHSAEIPPCDGSGQEICHDSGTIYRNGELACPEGSHDPGDYTCINDITGALRPALTLADVQPKPQPPAAGTSELFPLPDGQQILWARVYSERTYKPDGSWELDDSDIITQVRVGVRAEACFRYRDAKPGSATSLRFFSWDAGSGTWRPVAELRSSSLIPQFNTPRTTGSRCLDFTAELHDQLGITKVEIYINDILGAANYFELVKE